MSKGRIVAAATATQRPPIACAVCGAPSGQVTLMNIDDRGYVCFGGDCQKQKVVAMRRLFRRGAVAGRRLQRSLREKPVGKPKKQRRPKGEADNA